MENQVITDPVILKKYKQYKKLKAEYVKGLSEIRGRVVMDSDRMNSITATLNWLETSTQEVKKYAAIKKPALEKLQRELKDLMKNDESE